MIRTLDATRVAWGIALGLLLVLFAAYFLLPVYVMVVTALKSLPEVRLGNMLLPPAIPTLEPLARAWSQVCVGSECGGLSRYFGNSVAIVLPAVPLAVLFGAVNGYALTKWPMPGVHLMFGLLLAGNFLPAQMVILPMAQLLSVIGLFGRYEGLVLAHVVYGMPVMTLLFRNYFAGVPDEIVRAARVDGAGFWAVFLQVLLPMSLPMLAVATMLEFTYVWNDFLFALIFGGRDAPMTVALNTLINAQFGEKEHNVHMAGTLIAALPTLAVYLLAGKWFVRGLSAGAVKG